MLKWCFAYNERALHESPRKISLRIPYTHTRTLYEIGNERRYSSWASEQTSVYVSARNNCLGWCLVRLLKFIEINCWPLRALVAYFHQIESLDCVIVSKPREPIHNNHRYDLGMNRCNFKFINALLLHAQAFSSHWSHDDFVEWSAHQQQQLSYCIGNYEIFHRVGTISVQHIHRLIPKWPNFHFSIICFG